MIKLKVVIMRSDFKVLHTLMAEVKNDIRYSIHLVRRAISFNDRQVDLIFHSLHNLRYI